MTMVAVHKPKGNTHLKLAELLDKFSVPYKQQGEHHHATSGRLQIDCPYCSSNTDKFRMGIATDLSRSNCWTCGIKNPLNVIADLLHQPYSVVKGLVSELELERIERLPIQGKLTLPKGITKLIDPHIRYLHGRGFDVDELTRLWVVKGIGLSFSHPWCIFIPIYFQGEVVSWTTRSISDNGGRYVNAKPTEEAVPLKGLIYGEDYLRSTCIVVEGPTDVWRVGPGAVCTFGIVYTSSQVFRISKYPVRVLAFDAEEQAQKKARELCNALSVYPGKTYQVVIDSKDPGEATRKEIKRLRRFLE